MSLRFRGGPEETKEDEDAQLLGGKDGVDRQTNDVTLVGARDAREKDDTGTTLLISDGNVRDKQSILVQSVLCWCRTVFLMVIIAAGLTTAVCLYFFMLRTNFGPPEVNGEHVFKFEQKFSKVETMEESLIKEFPGFFRDSQEQEKIAGVVEETSGEKETGISPDKESASFAGHHSHGCCVTQGKFWTPEEGHDITKTKRKILQFPKFKQFFYHEVSRQVDNCQNCHCRCMMHPIWVRAVYEDDHGKAATQLFNLSYVYKCLNI